MLRSIVRALLALVATALVLVGVVASPASAADESVQGRLTYQGEPVADVTISVEGEGYSADGTSGADGSWQVPVPGPGSYSVTLDEGTLPEGVDLRFPDRNPLTTTVASSQQKPIIFALGESTRTVQSRWELAAQRFASGIRFGLLLALAAVGLSLIFGTTGLTNFAHGELVTFGALVAYFFNVIAGVPLLLGSILTVIVAGIAGYLLDSVLWAPLRNRGTGLIAMMIVSIGLSIFVRYTYLFFFGGNTRTYRDAQGQTGVLLNLSWLDFASMGLAIVVLLAVAYALLRTRIGKATRAVADNPALASASGIDVERVIKVVWFTGAALAGLAGVLLGVAQQVNWQMGFQILLLIFAAVTLGGLGTAFGALVGALVVGLFIELSTLFIPTELKNVGALGILIVILLVRPQGLLGRRERVG